MTTTLYNSDDRVERLNQLLSYYVRKPQSKLKADERHIISDPRFQKAVQDARERLGLGDSYLDYETDIDEWSIEQLSGKPYTQLNADEQHHYRKQFLDACVEAVEKANLPYGWLDYIGAYIALGIAPTDIEVEHELRINVLKMDDAGILVNLEKGLSGEDYKNAWKAFKEFLEQPTPYVIKEDELKNKIYSDYKNGDTPSVIAKRYFPDEYKTVHGKTAAKDKVKKVIRRFKT